jgi:hypothetical protein
VVVSSEGTDIGTSWPDYEILLHRSDGSLSIIMKIAVPSDGDAKLRAQTMLRGGMANAHIWCDGRLVDSIYSLR